MANPQEANRSPVLESRSEVFHTTRQQAVM
jgi:hypothetical protein